MFDRFYPIFDSPEWLERMLPLGLKLVQLRCKTREGEALRKAITTAQALCDAHDCILVVNDYWREAPEGHKIVGDVDTDAVINIAGWITPVPGGVGPVTVAILMRNAMVAHKRQINAGWL